jgi:hypothetical protein
VTDSHDGLNEITATGATGLSYDARHNIAAIGATTYSCNAENMLTSGGGANLLYDPLLRLYQLSATRRAYDGDIRHGGSTDR